MSNDAYGSEDWNGWRPAPIASRLRWRVVATLGAFVAWICLMLLYLAFWARGFSLFQSLVVVVVSLLALLAVVAGTWISFGMRLADGGRD